MESGEKTLIDRPEVSSDGQVEEQNPRQSSPNPDNRNEEGSGPREGDSPSDPSGPDYPGEQDGDPQDNPPEECHDDQAYIDELINLIEILEEKKQAWDEIVAEGLETYRVIEPMFKKKCYACHDRDRGVPWYGKPFKERNPIYHHYVDGIAALDFSTKFPLSSEGTTNQVALLTAIKNSVLDETMPLKAYTRIFPKRKITPQDKMNVTIWANNLIEKIQDWEQKFVVDIEDFPIPRERHECQETPSPSPSPSPSPPSPRPIDIESHRKKVTRVFSNKCFRCHANGAAKGGFGDMQNLPELVKSNYIDLSNPDLSEIYLLSDSGEMPPSKRERLNQEELLIIFEWIKAEADTIK